MLPALQARWYWSRGMRLKQAIAARAKRAWEPIACQIEGDSPEVPKVTEKKRLEKSTAPDLEISRYLESRLIGRPRTPSARREAALNLKKRRFCPQFLGQVKPRMKLIASALEISSLPLPNLPEVAVIGRSNAGKSTLLNSLCGAGKAKVSARPGSTQALNFFNIGKPSMLTLVDMPGYGFAFAPEAKRLQWTEFSLWYLMNRSNLKRVLILIDGRWGLMDSDKEMIAFLSRKKLPWLVIITKCDMVPVKELSQRITVLNEELKKFPGSVGKPIPVSARQRQGMDELRNAIDQVKMKKDVVIAGIQKKVENLIEEKRLRREAKEEKFPDDTLKQWGIERNAGIVKISTQTEGILSQDDFAAPCELPKPPTAPIAPWLRKNLEITRNFSQSEIVNLPSAPPQREKRARVFEHSAPLIGMNTTFSVPKGIAKWKVVGRPSSRAPPRKAPKEVNDLIGAREKNRPKMRG